MFVVNIKRFIRFKQAINLNIFQQCRYPIITLSFNQDGKICLQSQYLGQMLPQSNHSEKNVQRSLDRLQIFLNTNNLTQIIPALYYSADLLKVYSERTHSNDINYSYFRQFKSQIQNFATKDFSNMKQHQRQILDEILEIVNSELFTECLQPNIKSGRIMKHETEESHSLSKTQIKVEHQKDSFLKHEAEKHHQNIKNYQTLYNQLLLAYEQHRIDEAYQLKNKYIENGYPLQQKQKEFFSTIQLQYNTMISFYKQFDLQGWVFDKEQNGVTLEYKMFEEEKQIAIRISSQFDICVQNFLAILTEIDLMGTYIPFTYDSKQLKIISRNQKIGTSKIYIPFLTDRQTYFYAAGYDRIKMNGSIFLFSKTINEDKLYQEKYQYKVPEQSEYIRLEYKFFIVEYIPVNRSRAKLRLASKVDMKLNFLPQFILNKSARIFAFDYFKNIIKVNKNFGGSAWSEKIDLNPQFYNFFRKKVEQYIEKGRI